MKPPATIRILHFDYQLRFVDEIFGNAAGCFAHCDNKHLTISVLKSLPPVLLADSTLHECWHGICFAIGCKEKLTQEQIALQFSGPMCLLIRDNPELFLWLQSLLRPGDVDDSAYA